MTARGIPNSKEAGERATARRSKGTASKRKTDGVIERVPAVGSGVIAPHHATRSVFDAGVWVPPPKPYQRAVYEAVGCVIREKLTGERLA